MSETSIPSAEDTKLRRRAEASRVEVRLQKLKDGFCLEITDDGKSFPAKRLSSAAKRKRLGLLCMRERVETVGGTLSIESKPGQGTSIRAEIPFIDRIANG